MKEEEDDDLNENDDKQLLKLTNYHNVVVYIHSNSILVSLYSYLVDNFSGSFCIK